MAREVARDAQGLHGSTHCREARLDLAVTELKGLGFSGVHLDAIAAKERDAAVNHSFDCRPATQAIGGTAIQQPIPS
ncbi:MAG: hypothetical protein QGG53_31955 [Planctomycetota bacterium]|nr:hypothetical protein [Planctomycetota bacterium]